MYGHMLKTPRHQMKHDTYVWLHDLAVIVGIKEPIATAGFLEVHLGEHLTTFFHSPFLLLTLQALVVNSECSLITQPLQADLGQSARGRSILRLCRNKKGKNQGAVISKPS